MWLAASGAGADLVARGAAVAAVFSLVYLCVMAYARRAFNAGTRLDPAYTGAAPGEAAGDAPDSVSDDR